jgi:hypothetical protein
MLAVVEVAVHPSHQAVEHIAGTMAVWMVVGERPAVALATQVQDVFQDDPNQVFGGPLAERSETLRETAAIGCVVCVPDPSRNLRKHVLQMLGTVADLEPSVQEAQEDDDFR